MSERLDRELDLKAIAGFAIGLLLVTAASFAGLWYFSKALRTYEVSKDPPPPALAAARAPYLPPEPRLQTDPEGELVALRATEDGVLETYAWVDEAKGVARVPIERAITLLVGDNRPPTLDETPAAPTPEEAAH